MSLEYPMKELVIIPRAYVVKKQDSSLTEEEVEKFISDQLSDHKKLRGGVKIYGCTSQICWWQVIKKNSER